MTVYPDLIRACAHYYISQGIEINKMKDYEVVCRSILEKYTKLGRSVSNFCKIQNASPTIKAVKRLNPHWFVSHSLSKCIRNKRHNMKRYGGPVITSETICQSYYRPSDSKKSNETVSLSIHEQIKKKRSETS